MKPSQMPYPGMRRPRAFTIAQTVEKMREGFLLCASHGFVKSVWLQRKPGCGGETFDVSRAAFHSLAKNGRIRAVPRRAGQSLSTAVFELTP